MAPLLDPKFCAKCGAPMERRVPPLDRRPRPVCTRCGFVHYLDPKVACGTIPVDDQGRIVLIERGIEPRKGFWSFPCGFMEVDETAEEAAVRETREETGLEVRLDGLLGTYSYADSFYGGAVVVVVYKAVVAGGTLRADDDVSDVRVLVPAEIPWDRLAFRSSIAAFRDWLSAKGLPVPGAPA